ncbi:MAG: response regulator [Synergistaceae bacterium]|jgi:putative two-component system response regulator|nr:response regulator [Synergistaceae bacterium]
MENSAGRSRHRIVLVDDNMTNLTMGKNILKAFYEVFPLPSGAKLFELLEKVLPDLILLDIEMPEMNGYEAIRRLRSDPRFAEIPVIFLTAKKDEGSELEGLSLGAIDYILKPFSAPLLLKRIENHLLISSQKKALKNYSENLEEMVERKTRQVTELQNAILTTVAEMVEFNDIVTGGHVYRTQEYLKLLVDALIRDKIYESETAKWDLGFLIPSAQLHDVGKIAISDAILNKPGKLTPEEFEEMKKHVLIGVCAIEIIEENTTEHAFLHHAKIIAGTHHEKWDGTGYPMRLRGYNIPLEGRLMAIADVYDALISVRPYKEPLSAKDAERIIREETGIHFDPTLVNVFCQVAGQFAEIAGNYRNGTQPNLWIPESLTGVTAVRSEMVAC